MKKQMLTLSAVGLALSLVINPIAVNAAESLVVSAQQPSLAPMLERVMPSVVSIYVEGSQEVQQQMPQQFRQFFGNDSPLCMPGSPFGGSPLCQNGNQPGGQQSKQKFQTLGAGVVINAEKGYVVTNNHVVNNADKISVQLMDGRKYEAKVLGKDARSDIALLQLKEVKGLVAIKLADSDQLRVGDFTVAIGNPYGLGETVTSGIVSALGRSGLNTENYENFIQTDAAINRGNSGGALVNLSGELIGINTAILAPDGGNIGIGFAIPSNMVKNLVNQIIEYGQVRRGELGIMGTELTAELANALKVDEQKGAFISQIVPNSAAAKAGVKAGDVIVALNGKAIVSFASFRAQVGSLPIGSKLSLGLIREGKPLTIDVVIAQGSQNQIDSGNIYAGIEGAELINTQVGEDKGVKVENVKTSSAAEHIGLKKDDVIMAVNQQRTENLGELRKILDTKPAVLVFNVRRGNGNVYLLAQ